MRDIRVAMLACDAAVLTGSWNLIGVFSVMRFEAFPAEVEPFHLFVAVRELPRGVPTTIHLQLSRTDIDADGVDAEVLSGGDAELVLAADDSDASAREADIAVLAAKRNAAGEAVPIVVGGPGMYTFEAFVGDALVGETTMRLVQTP